MPELRLREKQRYDAWYCGLCRCLGRRYGQAARLLLSYDSAFLALFASAARGWPSPCEKHHCPTHPLFRKKLMVERRNPALEYAADVCVILAQFKLQDDVRDGKPLRAAASLPLLHAFKKAKKLRPLVHSAIESGMEALTAIEKEAKPSVDLAANCFGGMLRAVFENIPEGEVPGEKAEDTQAVLSEFGFWVGRAIYLLDAWDDREKDRKHSLYNPFNLCKTGEEEAEFAVNFSVNSAISAFELLPPPPGGRHPDLAIVRNILCEGFFAVWDGIGLKAEKKRNGKRKKRRVSPGNGGADKE